MPPAQNRRFAAARRQKVTERTCRAGRSRRSPITWTWLSRRFRKDMQHVRRQWEVQAVSNFDQLRARELQKLDYLERESWAAWEQSKKPAQSAVVTDQGTGAAQKTRKSLKHQIGDPRFLEQINKCITQRRALLGLDVLPVLPAPEGFDVQLSLDQRRERVFALVAAFSQYQRIGGTGAAIDHLESGGVRPGDEPGTLADGPASETVG